MDHLVAHLQLTIRYGLHRTVWKKHMLSTQKKEYQEKTAYQVIIQAPLSELNAFLKSSCSLTKKIYSTRDQKACGGGKIEDQDACAATSQPCMWKPTAN